MDLDPTDDNFNRLKALVVLLQTCLLSDLFKDGSNPVSADNFASHVHRRRLQKPRRNETACHDAVRACAVIFASEILFQANVEVNQFQELRSFVRLLACETFVEQYQQDDLLQCLADAQSKADTRVCSVDLETWKANLPPPRTFVDKQFKEWVKSVTLQTERAVKEEEELAADVKAMQTRAIEAVTTKIMPRVTRLCETNALERKNRHDDLKNEVADQISARTLQSRLTALHQTLQDMEDSVPWQHMTTLSRLTDIIAQHDQAIRYIHETTRTLVGPGEDNRPTPEFRSVNDDMRQLQSLWENVKRLGQQALEAEDSCPLSARIDSLLSTTSQLNVYMDQYKDTICRPGLYEDVVSQLNHVNDIVVNHDVLLRNMIDPKEGLNGLPITRERARSHVFREGKAFSRPVEQAIEKAIEARIQNSIKPLLERIDRLERQVQGR